MFFKRVFLAIALLVSGTIARKLDIAASKSTSGAVNATIWSDTAFVKGASWMRLYFSFIKLENSIVKFTSLLDGNVQTLNTKQIEEWRFTSAYFNGDAVKIEVVSTDEVSKVDLLLYDASTDLDVDPDVDTASVCYNPDRRFISNDHRQGRYLYGGTGVDGCCTAWLINDRNGCFLSARHCSESGFGLVEFNVPPSNPTTGRLVHPGPEDQYIVDQTSMQAGGSGTTRDWRYFGVHQNPLHGTTPIDRYGGGHYRLAPPGYAPPPGTNISIIGFGETAGVPRERRVQKTAYGPFSTGAIGTMFRYRVDTSNGNSGSAVFDETNQLAIGVHTLGGCRVGSATSSNSGPGLDAPGFRQALASPRGVCA